MLTFLPEPAQCSHGTSRRRGTGLVRTLVIASATLAILVVLFSAYQSSQLDSETMAKVNRARLPDTPDRPLGYDQSTPDTTGEGVPVGSVTIHEGKKIHMTLYREQDERAWIELAVKDWTPVRGAANEFLLSEPDIRLRTKDGHPVRVRADRGNLEAHRRAGTGLDPKRGRLEGNVVIEYDRLSETQRAALPAARRDHIDPEDLIQIELDELEFDLEYAKLMIPGRMRLVARDAMFEAEDLEMRFNEVKNRVEYLRVGRGGRIDIRQQPGNRGLTMPGAERNPSRQATVVGWLRATLESKLAEKAADKTAPRDATTDTAVVVNEVGVPVFRPEAEDQSKPGRSLKYYARFHGDVDAARIAGETVEARLTADLLELVRTLEDEPEAPSPGAASIAAPAGTGPVQAESAPQERIVLTWEDRLVVEACNEDDERCAGAGRALMRASGSPTRLVSPESQVDCHKLTYDPDGGKIWIEGTDTDPAVVDYGDQGTITGAALYTDESGGAFHVRVTGPGRLQRRHAARDNTVDRPASGDSFISFAGAFEADGRIVTYRPKWYIGDINTRTRRVLDKATFEDAVHLVERETTLDADKLRVSFGENRARETIIEHVNADGHVSMTQNDDRLTCRELDVTMTSDDGGRSAPDSAIAWGDVVANQGERTIEAREKLIIDFAMVPRDPPPTDDADRAGTNDPRAGTQDDMLATAPEAGSRTRIAPTRMQAFGDVTVTDPTQQLDLSAEQLDCTITTAEGGRNGIESAVIQGADDQPASVRLDDLTVVGSTIRLNAQDEWVEVPAAGRLTFRSLRKLSGATSDEPVATAITWADSMTYQGRENRAEFLGEVHASSEDRTDNTTFDCDRLRIEFEDTADEDKSTPRGHWPPLKDLVNPWSNRASDSPLRRRIRKEPTYILADGHAVALSSQVDPQSRELESRARIEGPRLSVYLRDDVSKMIIEGSGSLLLEDYRPQATPPATDARSESLLSMDDSSGPSTTLVQWTEEMWYDFSVDQTLFRGDVNLKHFSGERLAALTSGAQASDDTAGRATFLNCDALIVDFLSRTDRTALRSSRIGRLSAQRLEQFQATGSVVLQDQAEGLSLTADNVIYWKNRNLLAIYGAPDRKAHIVKRKPGQLPSQATAERLFYNLSTGDWELHKPDLKSR